MAEKKVTVMVIKVDLDCEKCRKKIKRILCKITEIQNQMYDEKANTVTISVFSCCPEKIKAKICCKGGKSIKGIEIKPDKPKDQKPDKPKETTPEKPKDSKPDKPKETVPDKPKETTPEKPKDSKPDKPKETVPDKAKDPKTVKFKDPPVVEPSKPKPTPTSPPPAGYLPPVRTCCRECYEGYGGPCYGTPVPCYEAYGRPVYDSWGGYGYGYGYPAGCRRGCYGGRCNCPCEDRSSSCSVM